MDTFFLKKLLADSPSKNSVFQRNILKDYFQIAALDYIYSHPTYSKLIFYGGSSLAHCYGLPRLSEDLDFVDIAETVDLSGLAEDLKKFFEKELEIAVQTSIQKFRILLKLPILGELGLSSNSSESNILMLKIEIFGDTGLLSDAPTEIIPIFKHGRSMLVRSFDLPTLMATKIRAVLHRKWTKTNKEGDVLASVKGRDYFDLMWYLEKGVKPNLTILHEVQDMADLKRQLLDAVEKADARSIAYDLEAFISDNAFVSNVSKNIKDILRRAIANL